MECVEMKTTIGSCVPATGMEMNAMSTVNDRHMVIDEIMEDHIFFNETTEPLMNSTEFFAAIEAEKARVREEELKTMGKSATFLMRAHGTVITPMNKAVEDMNPTEKTKALQGYWKAADKNMIRIMTQESGAEGESQYQWAKRMGLKAPKNRDQRYNFDWVPWVQREQPPTAAEIAWAFGHLYDPELGSNDEGYPENPMTETDVDVLEMSWPEQRAFRHRNPDGYEAWVKALKEEMGAFFDESLVLPAWKGVVVEKPREVDEDELEADPAPGEYIPESAKSTEVVQ